MKPFYRLVDPGFQGAVVPDPLPSSARRRPFTGAHPYSTVAYRSETILDESRYVLFPALHASILPRKKLEVPKNGPIRLSLKIPPRFRDSARLLLLPRVKQKKTWADLPSQIVQVASRDAGHEVSLALALPSSQPGATVEINVHAYAIPETTTTRYLTPELKTPANARLDFAFGVLEPAWDQGAVDFEIRVCEAEGAACQPLFSERFDPLTETSNGWQDRTLPLEPWSGQTVRLSFETSHVSPAQGQFTYPVWANPTVHAPAPKRLDGPNVIVLSLDTLSASHLEMYGYRRATAPYTDELFGKKGTVFTDCTAPATATPQSHMTMFTALQPMVHEITTGIEALHPWIPTLAEVLRSQGVETGAITENGWLGTVFGFARGFNSYAENKSSEMWKTEGHLDLTLDKAKHWLGRHRDKRFFLFLHSFQVHDPYSPPESYNNLFTLHEGHPIEADSLEHIRAIADYDREIRYSDDLLRSFVEFLGREGFDRNTVLIVTSDHGEEFLEHGHMGHSTYMYREVLHVPLLFLGPGIPVGRRIDVPVGLIDLTPTILEFFGLDKLPLMSGLNLLGLISEHAEPSEFLDRPIYSESWGQVAMAANGALEKFQRPALSVRKGSWNLMRYRVGIGYRYELYNVAYDPLERTNLYSASEAAAIAQELRKLLDSYPDSSRRRRDEIARANRVPAQRRPEVVELDPEREEKLRALGYIH
jgi:arylsulfatase A-like enzyme